MLRKMKLDLNKKEGFTLIELMIVVAILGVLAAVAIPQYMSYIATSKRRSTLENFDNAKRGVKGEFARIDAGNTFMTETELIAELNGEAMTWTAGERVWDGIPINFNPYSKDLGEAFIVGPALEPDNVGQVGLVTSYTGTGDAPTSQDIVTLTVAYTLEDGTDTVVESIMVYE